MRARNPRQLDLFERPAPALVVVPSPVSNSLFSATASGASAAESSLIRREFLGWDRPCLHVAMEHLVKRSSSAHDLDLRHLVVALPAARPARRLLELLVDHAETTERALMPPRIVTVGALPDLFFDAALPVASDFARPLLWAEALRTADESLLRRLTAPPPERGDWRGWAALGRMIDRLHREIAGAGLSFDAIARRGLELSGFPDAQRWLDLGMVHREYVARLASAGLEDSQRARRSALERNAIRCDEEVVLVAATDLNATLREMLDRIAPRVTCLIHAPAALAARFDAHGCVIPDRWLEQPIEISNAKLTVVDGPAEQSASVIAALRSLEARFSADEIVIGVPGTDVIPTLDERLQRAGLPGRSAAGLPLAQSAPYRLLEAIGDYLHGDVPELAALVRHPDFERRLQRDDVATLLDQYRSDHLPRTVTHEWLGPSKRASALRRIQREIETILAPLRGPARPLQQWAQPIESVLVDVVDRPLDRDDPRERVMLEACDALHAALIEMNVLPESLTWEVTASEAIQLALDAVADVAIEQADRGPAIELLGWLELALDDAPVLIITGFNEGVVPAAVPADPFLPNALRRHLGLLDDECRYARDAYVLESNLSSRTVVQLVAGRTDASGAPLAPSRLALASDATTVAQRLLSFYDDRDAVDASALGVREPLIAARASTTLAVPRPLPLSEPLEFMRVTSFRDYLACPYRFYLRHVLGLRKLTDDAAELDALAFGSLMHDVLADFGNAPAADSRDAEPIAAFLSVRLDAHVLRTYGASPMPAVRVQVRQLRERLDAFAGWQAKWRRSGYQITHTEWNVGDRVASLDVDGTPFWLHGRIDRVDAHEITGERVLFDYKSSARDRTPEVNHRSRGSWVDLQLPLYRHLARAGGLAGPMRLGYVVLPDDADQVGESMAEWTDEDLVVADETAQDVVRKIRGEVFWPPTVPTPQFFDEYASICQDHSMAAVLADEDTDESDEERT